MLYFACSCGTFECTTCFDVRGPHKTHEFESEKIDDDTCCSSCGVSVEESVDIIVDSLRNLPFVGPQGRTHESRLEKAVLSLAHAKSSKERALLRPRPSSWRVETGRVAEFAMLSDENALETFHRLSSASPENGSLPKHDADLLRFALVVAGSSSPAVRGALRDLTLRDYAAGRPLSDETIASFVEVCSAAPPDLADKCVDAALHRADAAALCALLSDARFARRVFAARDPDVFALKVFRFCQHLTSESVFVNGLDGVEAAFRSTVESESFSSSFVESSSFLCDVRHDNNGHDDDDERTELCRSEFYYESFCSRSVASHDAIETTTVRHLRVLYECKGSTWPMRFTEQDVDILQRLVEDERTD